MNRDKLQSIISKGKIYITGSGVKLNYSFVPALANRLFTDYMQKSIIFAPKIYRLNEKLQDVEYKKLLVSSEETINAFNEENKELQKEGEEINAMGMKIILMILERNEQPIEINEEAILTEMDLNDMNGFLQASCSVSDAQKKNR